MMSTQIDGIVGHGRAHGKALLLGEHTVVYGTPAIAIPLTFFPVEAQARNRPGADADTGGTPAIEPGSTAWNYAIRSGSVGEHHDPHDGIRTAVNAAVAHWGTPRDDVEVFLSCEIPLIGGLGSSAACTAAAVRAVADLYSHGDDLEMIRALVQTGEQVAHGRSSGVDAAAVLSQRPIRFQAGSAQPLLIGLNAVLVLADTGVAGFTAPAVSLVRTWMDRDLDYSTRLLKRATGLIESAVHDVAFGRRKELGRKMTEFHTLLTEIGVSIPHNDRLVSAALDAGAYGAKLTGGGLGGCVLALAEDRHRAVPVAEAMRRAGATRTWIVDLTDGQS